MFQIEITEENQELLNIKPKDLGIICRLCLKKAGTINLFNRKENRFARREFKEIISSLSLLTLFENDGLPQKICNACSNLIKEFYLFKEKINAAQVVLHIALGKVKLDKNQVSFINVQQNKFDMHQEEIEINVGKVEIEIADEEFATNNEYNTKEIDPKQEQTKDKTEEKSKEPLEDKLRRTFVEEYVCSFCEQKFVDRNSFLKHRKSEKKKFVDVTTKIKCYVCDKMIVKGRFEDHMNTHTKNKPHKCELCGKGFCSKPNLYNHKVTHREVKPHICDLCGRGFALSPTLRDHLRWHKREYNFICDICGFHTFTKSSLAQHQRSHRKKRNDGKMHSNISYCNICDREFRTFKRLVYHMSNHVGDKPFKCPKCDKSFFSNNHLLWHQMQHDKRKPCICQHCGKAFSRNNNLQRHIKKHSKDQTAFSCVVCKDNFSTNSCLNEHMKMQHENFEVVFCPNME